MKKTKLEFKTICTIEELMEACIRTAQQMTPEEKAKFRQQMDKSLRRERRSGEETLN